MKKKLLSVLLSAGMILTLLSGCGSGNAATEGTANTPETVEQGGTAEQGAVAEHGKTATVAVNENILSLDPHNQNISTGLTMGDLVFNKLLRSDHAGNYYNDLAKDYEISEDGLEWTITLQEGVQFHDGEAFNADDVICTYQRILDNPTLAESSNFWGHLKAIEKIDDYTVKLSLANASPATMIGLANTVILPDEAYGEMGDKLFTEQIMTGTGPWVFDEWIDGEYLHFTKNENYWDGGNNSYFDDLYIRFVTEPSTAISAQITGEVDAYFNTAGIPTDLLGLYDGQDLCKVFPIESNAIDYLGFQCGENSVFKNPDVRRAFSMAIDRQGIADALFGGGSVPIGIANSKTIGYDENLTSEYYEYNPDAAKALLESTDYNGEEITISSLQLLNNTALAICDMVNAIGFNCNAEVLETATLADIRAKGDYDAFIVPASYVNGDLYQFIMFRIYSDAHTSEYKNDELRALIEASNQEMDADARNELLKQVNEIIVNDCAPMVSLIQLENNESTNKGITGIDFTSDGLCMMRDIDYDPSLAK